MFQGFYLYESVSHITSVRTAMSGERKYVLTTSTLISTIPHIIRSNSVVPGFCHQIATWSGISFQEKHIARPVVMPKLLSAMNTYNQVRSILRACRSLLSEFVGSSKAALSLTILVLPIPSSRANCVLECKDSISSYAVTGLTEKAGSLRSYMAKT